MAAVLRSSRYLVGRSCKHVDFAFGKENKRRQCMHCARRCAHFRSSSCYLKARCDLKTPPLLETLEDKFEYIFGRLGLAAAAAASAHSLLVMKRLY